MKGAATLFTMFALFVAAAMPAAGQEDIATQASLEYLTYLRSPSMCKGEEAELAAQIGIGRWHEWKFATDQGEEPPAKAFADAGQAFAHLYNEMRCRDGLIMYRYGNLLRLNESYQSAIQVMEASLPRIREHYPGVEKTVESSLGLACASAGRHDDAIVHYRRVLQLDPQDTSIRLNLATQLLQQGDKVAALEHAEKALEFPLSEHGQQVAVEIIKKTTDSAKP